MRYLMRVDTTISKVSHEPVYLHACDHEADHGRGRMVLTHNPEKAVVFASPDQGKIFWSRTNSRGYAPLAHLSVEMVALEVARLVWLNKSKILSKNRS